MLPFQIVYGLNLPTPVNRFNSLTNTNITNDQHQKIVRDNVLDAQNYFKRGGVDVIFVVGENVMVKRKFLQTNLSKDLISNKLESENCGPSNITVIHGNNVTFDLEEREWFREDISMPEPEKRKPRTQNTPSYDRLYKLFDNQNKCTPHRLESMEELSSLRTTYSFYPGEDELI
ncbi:hypothetical protein ACTFIR_003789 [Dictyostelium discoideum]